MICKKNHVHVELQFSIDIKRRFQPPEALHGSKYTKNASAAPDLLAGFEGLLPGEGKGWKSKGKNGEEEGRTDDRKGRGENTRNKFLISVLLYH